jgi:RNA polymerase sigma factor (sigma-70 family)
MLPRGGPPAEADALDAVEVVRIGYGRLLAVARRLTTSLAEAEDLVQEAFVETLSRYPGFEGLERPLGYLATVVYRAAFRRRRLTAREVSLDILDRIERADADLDAPAMAETALAGLGTKQRACLALRYLCDLDDDEIAAALGCRESTVRSQIARALAHARGRIADGD